MIKNIERPDHTKGTSPELLDKQFLWQKVELINQSLSLLMDRGYANVEIVVTTGKPVKVSDMARYGQQLLDNQDLTGLEQLDDVLGNIERKTNPDHVKTR